MKSKSIQERHDAALRSVARTMIHEGYRVLVEPRDEDLPDFLLGLRPDLIASKGEERLVVEVRLRGAPKKDWSSMIKRVESQPNWKFRLIVADEEGDELEFAPPDEVTIRSRLAEPEQLQREGRPVAALLVAWSLFEGAARRRLDLQNEEPPRGIHPEGVLQRLLYLGYLESDQFGELQTAARSYHRAAHGDLNVDVNDALLQRLREATEQLLTAELAA